LYFLLHPPPAALPYPRSLHDALPICQSGEPVAAPLEALHQFEAVLDRLRHGRTRIAKFAQHEQGTRLARQTERLGLSLAAERVRSEEHTSELQSRENLVCRLLLEKKK